MDKILKDNKIVDQKEQAKIKETEIRAKLKEIDREDFRTEKLNIKP